MLNIKAGIIKIPVRINVSNREDCDQTEEAVQSASVQFVLAFLASNECSKF